MDRIKAILFFMLPLYFGMVKGQDSIAHKYSFELKGSYSKILAHRGYVKPIGLTRFSLIDAAIERQTNGSKDWHHHYRLPGYGISLLYCNFDGGKYLGRGIGLITHFNFQLIKRAKFYHYIKLGAGLGYIEKIFNPEDNFKQVAIGSHVNACISLQFNYKIQRNGFAINPFWGLSHFSNAAIRVPNLGVNILSLGIGISMQSKQKVTIENNSLKKVCMHTKKTYYVSTFCYGVKRNLPELNKNYKEATLSVSIYKPFSYKSHWGLGTDLFYDELQQQKASITGGLNSLIKIGIHSAYSLNIDKFAIIMGLGFYVYDQVKYNTPFYNRVGFRYHVNNKWVVQTVILAHAARAHYLEAGIGYTINKK